MKVCFLSFKLTRSSQSSRDRCASWNDPAQPNRTRTTQVSSQNTQTFYLSQVKHFLKQFLTNTQLKYSPVAFKSTVNNLRQLTSRQINRKQTKMERVLLLTQTWTHFLRDTSSHPQQANCRVLPRPAQSTKTHFGDLSLGKDAHRESFSLSPFTWGSAGARLHKTRTRTLRSAVLIRVKIDQIDGGESLKELDT